MSKVQGQRNATLDIAKGLGIILVVLGHNWFVSHDVGELFRVIFSFHMPLFFFLSGVFLREPTPLRQFVASRTQSLLKPYFVTLGLFGLLRYGAEAVRTRDFPAGLVDYVLGVLHATGSSIVWAPLWYLPHLFLVSCSVLLLLRFVHSAAVRWVLTACLLLIGVLLLEPFKSLPWNVDLIPLSAAFLLAGVQCRVHAKEIVFNALHFAAVLLLFAALHIFFDETLDMNLHVYGAFVVTTLQAVAGIYLCLTVAAWLERRSLGGKTLSYIGSGTLFILLFHIYVQQTTFALLSKYMGNPLIPASLSLAAGVLVPLLMWEGVKRSKLLTRCFLPAKP